MPFNTRKEGFRLEAVSRAGGGRLGRVSTFILLPNCSITASANALVEVIIVSHLDKKNDDF